MGGITASTGIFSGIDSASLIDQLLAASSRPKVLFQQRIISLQFQQQAYRDINSALSALESAAAKFRTGDSFDQKKATSGNEDVLAATASAGAQTGSFQFVVDRLVSTQQELSRGFADKDSSGVGLTQLTFESADARLDSDTELELLNGGSGVQRGSFSITQGATTVEIDLSRASTVGEVLDAINGSGLAVTATASEGRISITSQSGTISVADQIGSSVAESLGLINGTNNSAAITGNDIYGLFGGIALSSLNDGRGVQTNNGAGNGNFDFTVDVGGTPVNVNLGEVWGPDPDGEPGDPDVKLQGRVGTVQGVIDRFNTALSDAGFGDVTLAISAGGNGLTVNDSAGGRTITIADRPDFTAAGDLGIAGSFTGSLEGDRLLAGLNSKLTRNLNGGAGIVGGQIDFTDRDGGSFSIDTTGLENVSDIVDTINAASGGTIVASLSDAGNGFKITDTTGGSGNLIIGGAGAAELGIGTDPAGIAAGDVGGTDLDGAYIGNGTKTTVLAGGAALGNGEIAVTDSNGVVTNIRITSSEDTVGALLRRLNRDLDGTTVQARINDTGDGILFEDTSGNANGIPIKIEDVDGNVGATLGIVGEASGPAGDNFIDGSLETTVDVSAADTLDEIVQKINDADPSLAATVVNDGSGTNPFRLSLAADESGSAGRFIIDTGAFDLGLSQLDAGNDARVFFGSSDPAKGLLITSSTNQLDDVVQGVSIDLLATSSDPVELSVVDDTETIVKDVQAFVDAFNNAIQRIDNATNFDIETEQGGPLVGDGTARALRQRLFNTVFGPPVNAGGQFDRLTDIGIRVADGGRLELDADEFRAALSSDPTSVESLLAARDLVAQEEFTEISPGVNVRNVPTGDQFSSLGIASLIENLVDDYINTADGFLTRRNDVLQQQIDRQNERIEDFDARLERQRLQLSREFLAMEQAIAQIQGQQNSLGQIAALQA